MKRILSQLRRWASDNRFRHRPALKVMYGDHMLKVRTRLYRDLPAWLALAWNTIPEYRALAEARVERGGLVLLSNQKVLENVQVTAEIPTMKDQVQGRLAWFLALVVLPLSDPSDPGISEEHAPDGPAT